MKQKFYFRTKVGGDSVALAIETAAGERLVTKAAYVDMFAVGGPSHVAFLTAQDLGCKAEKQYFVDGKPVSPKVFQRKVLMVHTAEQCLKKVS